MRIDLQFPTVVKGISYKSSGHFDVALGSSSLLGGDGCAFERETSVSLTRRSECFGDGGQDDLTRPCCLIWREFVGNPDLNDNLNRHPGKDYQYMHQVRP